MSQRLCYELASDRVASFSEGRGWPHGSKHLANPETLAEAGFRFMPDDESDLTKCFTCSKGLSDWAQNDDPFITHFQHNPKCPWALARCSVVTDKDKRGRYVFKDSTRLPSSKALVKARHETFRILPKIWPPDQVKGHGANSKRMAEAGFVYTPQERGDDTATCVYCDTSLSGWEPKDDPFDEHRSRNAKCPIFTAVLQTDELPNARPKRGKSTRVMESEGDEETLLAKPTTARAGKKAKDKENTAPEDEAPPRPNKKGKEKAAPPQASETDDVDDSVPVPRATKNASRPPTSRTTRRNKLGSESEAELLLPRPKPGRKTRAATEDEEVHAVINTNRKARGDAASAVESDLELDPPSQPTRRGRKTKAEQSRVQHDAIEASTKPLRAVRKGKVPESQQTTSSIAEEKGTASKRKPPRRGKPVSEADVDTEASQSIPEALPRGTASRQRKLKGNEDSESEMQVDPAPSKNKPGPSRRPKMLISDDDEFAVHKSETTRIKKKAPKTESGRDEQEYSVVALPTDSEAEELINPTPRPRPKARKSSMRDPDESDTHSYSMPERIQPVVKPKLKRVQSSRLVKGVDENFKRSMKGKEKEKEKEKEVVQVLPESDGAEVIGLLPVKKVRTKKTPKEDNPEFSHFSSFAELEMDIDAETPKSAGDDDDDDDDDLDLPEVPRVDMDIDLADLGYEDPFLSPGKRAGGMRLVKLDMDVEMNISTPTKPKLKPKADDDDPVNESTPLPPKPKPQTNSSRSPKPLRAPQPLPPSQAVDEPSSQTAPLPQPSTSKPSSQADRPEEPAPMKAVSTSISELVPEPEQAPTAGQDQEPQALDPSTPQRERTLQAFVASEDKLEIIPPLSELTEAERQMTVEQWIRHEMQRVCEAIRAQGGREIEEFLARADQVRKTIEALPEAL